MSSPVEPETSAMAANAPLAFRARRDIRVFWAVLVTAAAAFLVWPVLLPVRRAMAPAWFVLVCLGGAGVVAGLWWVAVRKRREMTLDASGLRLGPSAKARLVPWDTVTSVTLLPGGLFGASALSLRVGRPVRFWSLALRSSPWLTLWLNDWEDADRLRDEVVARVPDGILRPGVRAYLADPHRVAWRHRLPTLLVLVLSAALAGYAAWSDWLSHAFSSAASDFFIMAWLILGMIVPQIGGPLDREWRWKSALVRAGAVPIFVSFGAFIAEIAFGMSGAFALALAACLGWSVATLVVCLPIKPRGWLVAAIYGVAVAPALAAAWWLEVREPIPCRRTAELGRGPWHAAWSPDGRFLCGAYEPFSDGSGAVCHVVDAASLQVRSFPLPEGMYYRILAPDKRRVLLASSRREDVAAAAKLWALDVAAGETRLLHTAPDIGLAGDGAVSRERGEVLFVAGKDKQVEPFVLKLADLSVRKIELDFDLSRLITVRWRPDGKVMLQGYQNPKKGETEVSFWELAPGERKPACFYRATGDTLKVQVSPTVRWALVRFGRGAETPSRCEIVDLLTGQARPLPGPPSRLPEPYLGDWSSDGETFAYVVRESGRATVTLLRAATGEATPVYTAMDEEIGTVSPSRDARYVTWAAGNLLRGRRYVVDTATGRAFRLHAASFLLSDWSVWSPLGSVLAVGRRENFLLPDEPVRIRFYQFPSP